MDIRITFEIGEKATELVQLPILELSTKIDKLVAILDEVDFTIDSSPVPVTEAEPEIQPAVTAPIEVALSSESLSPPVSLKETILRAIREHKSGISTKDLQIQTGLSPKQISNNMFHLKKAQKVKKTKSGKYKAI